MLTVCHLYPDLLNLYGDRGNVMAFVRRCRWRNIPVQVKEVNIGETLDFAEVDFLFLGGGSDREQTLLNKDLTSRTAGLREAIEDGLVLLAICGGYQMLGRYYRTHEGEEIPGLGILDLYTEAGARRLIGNVAVEMLLDNITVKVTGFENHSGQTFLGDVSPLGKVLAGFGNNGRDKQEGARYKNVFCSYLHGPLLPKNTVLADYLITLAMRRRGISGDLQPLEDALEERANAVMLERLLKNTG
ncbi:CobB/CobQ domain protein glutamine amidotransferase [Desulfofarcimen acetoxidans DSM 771]|uniref:Lipid II isoglutaminyl synthase (glutamine-hydrolyzing) subunit GatD n=1 Tax=Desulfofarcimen acetoxidans (strain ATCC 49208 / DSM 771 / KCTC 5769 / VKM B-1644 / 5575) TaxID=485916 RepID=C8W4H1_DESAS|nr:glutamine amidotransferase [Desulfofarcimen acetoxidans]ACV62039.1 CobB/CobQ domain protein glutamine amidotransferase [Desulfofarcimen acetoxidans DSM 771]